MITENPWLKISSEDYEGHMSGKNVRQLHVLSQIFGKVISEYHPESIMVLGCTTGNGFEHFKGNEKVIGVDINPDYLNRCRKRFTCKLPNLDLICADLNAFEYRQESFDLIHAALIFEYVDVEKLLKKISVWLKQNGYLTVVLQLESKTSSAISETEFSSLKTLLPIHNLLDPKNFVSKCNEFGFKEIEYYEADLPGDKKFAVLIFQK